MKADAHSCTSVKLYHLIHFEVEQSVVNARWWLLLPVCLFIVYIATGSVLAEAQNLAITVNIWDLLFSIFADSNLIFFMLTLFYLYLVSSFLHVSAFDQSLLVRMGSRRLWWIAKVAALSLATLYYLIILVGITAAIASFVLPWHNSWSEGALTHPVTFFINPAILKFSPLHCFGELLLLLTLGWFCLGLLSLVAAQCLQRPIWGFGVSLLVNFSALIALRSEIPEPFSYFFIYQHLLLNYHAFGHPGSPYPAFFSSILYWVTGMLSLFILGLEHNSNKDFVREVHGR